MTPVEYDSDNYEPPAPVVQLEVLKPGSRKRKLGRGKVDSGADLTVIPVDWVRKLSLVPASVVLVGGYDGTRREVESYFVDICFGGFRFPLIEVIAARRGDALVGRDVLNKLKAELDGKKLNLGLFDP